MKLVLCSSNPGKLAELSAMLPAGLELIGLRDAGIIGDLPETGETLEANASQKARAAFAQCGITCIADDTGLEVDALGGAPGVRSARYAGEHREANANMLKLLKEMEGMKDRRARFRTVIALVSEGTQELFEGEVRGAITSSQRGVNGFGYDPIFQPEMSDLTFAEMDATAKNAISHRAHAVWKLARFLEEHYRPLR